jgi:DNA-binding PadR family transcriptional regulator
MTERGLSGVAVLLLALLAERPMHPYEAYQTLVHRRDTRLVRVNAGAVYHGFERLESAGLADRVGTERQGGRPERTTYSITRAGVVALVDRVQDLLVEDPPAYPLFPVALSEAECLPVAAATAALSARRSRLDAEVEILRVTHERLISSGLARRHVLELELEQAMLAAESTWLGGLIDELASGSLEWNPAPLDPDRLAGPNPEARGARS